MFEWDKRNKDNLNSKINISCNSIENIKKFIHYYDYLNFWALKIFYFKYSNVWITACRFINIIKCFKEKSYEIIVYMHKYKIGNISSYRYWNQINASKGMDFFKRHNFWHIWFKERFYDLICHKIWDRFSESTFLP